MKILWKPINKKIVSLDRDIHIWRVRLPLSDYQTLWHLLTENEKAKANRYYFEKDRYQLIAAYGILRILLGSYLCLPANHIQFETNQYGKPFVTPDISPVNIQFNLAHSHQCILYAFVLNYPVGIDIEFLRDKEDYQGLAERFFSRNESCELKQLAPDAKKIGFYQAWTRKEAYIKARGIGMSYHLNKFAVSLLPEQPAQLLWDDNDPEAINVWNFKSFTPQTNYMAALATTANINLINFFDWNSSIF